MTHGVNLGAVPWGGADTFKGLGVAVLGVLGMVALFGILNKPGLALRDGAGLPLILSLEGFLLLVAWHFSLRRHRLPWGALGFRIRHTPAHLLLPLGVLVASLFFTSLYVGIVTLLGLDRLMPLSLPEVLQEAQGASGVATAVLVVLWAPLAEETFFRGFLLQGLVGSMGPWGAATTSALLFALSHGALSLLVPTFISGLLLAWLFLRTRSMGACFIAHALQNALAFSAAT